MVVPKGDKQRRLHKALLRYHDPANWPLIRQALEDMGKKASDRWPSRMSGSGAYAGRDARKRVARTVITRPALTKHTPVAHQRQTPAANKKRGKVAGR